MMSPMFTGKVANRLPDVAVSYKPSGCTRPVQAASTSTAVAKQTFPSKRHFVCDGQLHAEDVRGISVCDDRGYMNVHDATLESSKDVAASRANLCAMLITAIGVSSIFNPLLFLFLFFSLSLFWFLILALTTSRAPQLSEY